MRDIKFRQPIFKDNMFERWHDWGFVGYKNEFVGPITIMGINNGYEIKESLQFTGLQDCQNKDIYEGDIIRFDPFYFGDHRELGGTAEVKYVDDGYGLYISNDDYVCCLWDAVKNYNAKITGNIYE